MFLRVPKLPELLENKIHVGYRMVIAFVADRRTRTAGDITTFSTEVKHPEASEL